MKYADRTTVARLLELDRLELAIRNQMAHGQHCAWLTRNDDNVEIYCRSATFAYRRAAQLAEQYQRLAGEIDRAQQR